MDTSPVDPIPTFSINGLRPPDGSNQKQIQSELTKVLLQKETTVANRPNLVKGQQISLTSTPPTPTTEEIEDDELGDRLHDITTAQKIVDCGILAVGSTDYNAATMPEAGALRDEAIGRYHTKLDAIIARRGLNANQTKIYIASLF